MLTEPFSEGSVEMSKLQIWFLDVGHGDCAYIQLPNGARMMIDCGCGADHWPSEFLKYYKITKDGAPVNIPNNANRYGLDKLVISHPHGDHIADIEAIHESIGFYLLAGGYRPFIDKISIEQIDWRKRSQDIAKKFVGVVKKYCGTYEASKDNVRNAKPDCIANGQRFVEYTDGIDLNEISFLYSFEIGGHKVLFTGDLTAAAVAKILKSDKASKFKEFVRGTTILKVPHHGRDNGCSQEMFDAFGRQPLLCILSDEILNENNEGTANTQWYTDRTSREKVNINGTMSDNRVLSTRKFKDIYIEISVDGKVTVNTNALKEAKEKIYGNS
ncbi:ComEC/Rec2 family competence protein [Phosphitispora sp. TUW77]|uniref:ComEC/Rec2 family competence protein n=1 Tax=Phosphitispora sp. TUW77 TaxID=3152361 RepID=UPI003AB32D88